MLSSTTVKLFGRPSLQKLARLSLTTAATQVSPIHIAQPKLITSFVPSRLSFSSGPSPATADMTTVSEQEYEILTKDNGNLWDQLRELINTQRWTTQDHATLSLLQEMPNVVNLFITRKSDNFLLGAVILIETQENILGNVYVMREGYRASGMGMKLVRMFMKILHKSFTEKPFLARGVPAMMGKYAGPPFYATHAYELYSYEFTDKKDLKDFFPAPASHPYRIVSVKDLTPRQFHQMIEYDKMVTGVDRTKFLTEYYSIDFVKGIVAFDSNNQIRGMAGLVPTTYEDGLFKLNPIYAENIDDASTFVHAVADQTNHPNAHFVLHTRTASAGDWMLKKCKDTNRKMNMVGVLCNATNLNQIYKDPSRTDLMFSPTNSPAHFDG